MGLEVLEEGVGVGGAIVLKQELVIVDEGIDVAGIDLETGLVGLFGGRGVTLMREQIGVGDGHVGIVFARLFCMRFGRNVRCGVAPVIE